MIKYLRFIRFFARLMMLLAIFVTADKAAHYAMLLGGLSQHPESVSSFFSFLETASKLGDKIIGGPVSVSIFGFEILDPFLGLVAILSTPDAITASLLAVSIPVFAAVIAGRFFCGYLCPVGWIATALIYFRRRLFRRKIIAGALPGFRYGWLIAAGILFSALIGFSNVAVLIMPHLEIERLATAVYDSSVVFSAAGILSAFIVFELLAPALWCRRLCPSGILYDLLAKKRFFKVVKKGTHDCPKNCFLCNEHCWLSLAPRSGNVESNCDLCLSCAVVCPQKRLKAGGSSEKIKTLSNLSLSLLLSSCVLFGKSAVASSDSLALEKGGVFSTLDSKRDIEVWKEMKRLSAGLSILFLEKTAESETYLFLIALTDARDADFFISSPMDAKLTSGNKETNLFFAEPNSPVSTPKKSIYSGRATIPADECASLSAFFPSERLSLSSTFPARCRKNSPLLYLTGILLFALPVTAILLLYFLSKLRRKRKKVFGAG